ncbi:glycosyl hydrolase [Haloferula sp. BvORR071]|uniref:glycosyl hydrolase n=1 Tax=Haloferula sp. BvORR071 TaxID=1396141 RepID=UPI0006963BE6|nr:glycosyl hydrolase [Haloferula sp. BvORR071]
MRCLPLLLSFLMVAVAPAQTAAVRKVVLTGNKSVHEKAEMLGKSAYNFDSPDAWLFVDDLPPAKLISTYMDRLLVNYEPAVLNANVRVAQYESGCVVIPQGPKFPAMTVYDGKSLSGPSMSLECHVKYNDSKLGSMKGAITSFKLKHGYMATLAENENGSGFSKNYVAQDQDLEVKDLGKELDGKVRFVRIFPWHWTSKKGIAGDIHQKLNVGWYYNWNLNQNSTAELEYVPIKQKKDWPGLDQDWKARGSTHLLGFNEPDRPDQAKMTTDEAIAAWPQLLATGLRLGSPAVSDGGLGWLYDFMKKADAAKLRVDFVAVHYYRAVADPGDGKAAAAQFYNFIKEIHERTGRPIWITEWNNGANWTGGKDPTEKDQAKAVDEMIKMLDKTPFVERYALYNWVEDGRMVQRKDGSLTPAGEIYRDKVSPLAYKQEK